jgi:hypothetical protein
MGTDPHYVRGSEIKVGDVVCTKVGNRMQEVMTVTAVDTSVTRGHTYVTLTGKGQPARSVLMFDDRVWVLRNG